MNEGDPDSELQRDHFQGRDDADNDLDSNNDDYEDNNDDTSSSEDEGDINLVDDNDDSTTNGDDLEGIPKELRTGLDGSY